MMRTFNFGELVVGDSVLLEAGLLSLRPGYITLITGPNGCGKSSLLLDMAGIRPDYIKGGLSRWNKKWTKIGLLTQDYNQALFPWLGIKGNIGFYNSKSPRTLLRDVSKDKRKVRELSGGMKQRLAITKELGVRRGLLLMDEPFSHQHPLWRAEIIRSLRRFVGTQGTVVIVSHIADGLKGEKFSHYSFVERQSTGSRITYSIHPES